MSCGPLHGVRVVEFSHMYAGPWGSLILGSLGAEVVKIESAVSAGDRMRRSWPDKDGRISCQFLGLNWNKRSIALDLAKPAARDVVDQLVDRADVVYSNFKE